MTSKPKISDTDDMIAGVPQTVDRENRASAKSKLREAHILNRIIGRSRAIKKVRAAIKQVADFDICVLITGESGTGKELAARAIHYLSSRKERAFIPINCGAIPDNLFENEFFGHAKGSFTGAGNEQTGLVKAAAGGTLFLDEISSISAPLQVKFLRLLENHEYKPLGDARPHKADIRIIAATNKNLSIMVEKDLFREDLFYRLNVINLNIPPLRKRREDIPLLVENFVAMYAKKFGKTVNRIPYGFVENLRTFPWKGNVRELENMIQRLVIMSPDDMLHLNHMQGFSEDSAEVPENFNRAKIKVIKAFEHNYLTQALKQYNGNVAKAAANSGKGRTAMWNLIKKHRLNPKDFR